MRCCLPTCRREGAKRLWGYGGKTGFALEQFWFCQDHAPDYERQGYQQHSRDLRRIKAA